MQEIYDAAEEGDHTLVRQLVDQGQNVNQMNQENSTPLLSACGGEGDSQV